MRNPSSAEQTIQFEQLQRLSQQLPVNMLANLAVVTSLYLVFSDAVALSTIIPWLLYSQVPNLYGIYILRHSRKVIASENRLTSYLRRFQIYSFLEAGMLVSACWLFFGSKPLFYDLFLAAVMLGTMAGGLMTLTVHMPSAILFSVMVGVSLFIRLIIEGNTEFYLLAGLSLIYLAVILRFATSFNQSLRKTWWLSHERNDALSMRMQAMSDMQESEERYRSLVEQSPYAILILVEDKLAYSNKAANKLLSIDENSINDFDFYGQLNLVPFEAGIAREDGTDLIYECALQKEDDTIVELEVIETTVLLHGEPAIQIIVNDISQRRKMDRMKDEIISTVSHELRTPLTSIYGAISILRALHGDKMDEKMKSLTDIVYNNSISLTNLINDILDISKIEAGELDIHRSEFILSPVIEKVIADNTGYARKFKVSLELENNIVTDTIYTDEIRLQQILNNLLSNAIKFSAENGIVKLILANDIDNLIVTVTDQGAGIPLSAQADIFSKFSHVDNQKQRIIKGTGLGLYLTKSLVEGMGGEIDFTSQPGVGTSFTVIIPCVK